MGVALLNIRNDQGKHAKTSRIRQSHAGRNGRDVLKYQTQVMRRSRHRAPPLTPWDWLVFGLLIPAKRRTKAAIVLKPSSFSRSHQALTRTRPGPAIERA